MHLLKKLKVLSVKSHTKGIAECVANSVELTIVAVLEN
jgi:hypothetical protein